MSNDPQYLGRLQDYYARHRVLPSYSAIGKLIGLTSKSSVAALVARLRLEGYLKQTPDKRLKPTDKFFGRALASASVRAGLPSPADDSPLEVITIDRYLVEKPSQTVLVRVKGDSMIDAGIREGDLVTVERRTTANAGDIVIAIVDNDFTLKYLAQESGKFVLKPANPAYPVIRPKGNLEIFGVVVGLVRKY
jgi:repressor LexA